jgi:hypothetical protein
VTFNVNDATVELGDDNQVSTFYDPRTGAKRWQAAVRNGYVLQRVGTREIALIGDPPRQHARDLATGQDFGVVPGTLIPAAGGVVYADSRLSWRANLGDARTVWSRPLPDHYQIDVIDSVQNPVILVQDGCGCGPLTAIDAKTGATRWTHPTAGLFQVVGPDAVINDTADPGLTVIDGATGNIRAHIPKRELPTNNDVIAYGGGADETTGPSVLGFAGTAAMASGGEVQAVDRAGVVHWRAQGGTEAT